MRSAVDVVFIAYGCGLGLREESFLVDDDDDAEIEVTEGDLCRVDVVAMSLRGARWTLEGMFG